MFKTISTFFRHILTEKDNTTFDLSRVLWAISILWFLVLSAVSVWFRHQTFDPMGFGGGVSTVLGAGGGALLLKSKADGPKD